MPLVPSRRRESQLARRSQPCTTFHASALFAFIAEKAEVFLCRKKMAIGLVGGAAWKKQNVPKRAVAVESLNRPFSISWEGDALPAVQQ